MKAMAELWGRGGQEFAAAQQKFMADMAKAAGQGPQPAAAAAAMFDPEGMTQANAAFSSVDGLPALSISLTTSVHFLVAVHESRVGATRTFVNNSFPIG